jgi:cytochrome c5
MNLASVYRGIGGFCVSIDLSWLLCGDYLVYNATVFLRIAVYPNGKNLIRRNNIHMRHNLMNKLFFAVLAVVFAQIAVAAPTIEQRYARSCNICHMGGAGGAPKTGDVVAWAPRLAQGMDALVESVNKGMGAMPPKGMCWDCSTDEFAALISYMAAPK